MVRSPRMIAARRIINHIGRLNPYSNSKPSHLQQLPPLTFTMDGGAVISLPPEQYTLEFKIPEVDELNEQLYVAF